MKIRNKLILGSFLVILSLIFGIYLYQNLTLENIKENKEKLSNFVNENYISSIIIFIALTALIINLPIPLAAIIKVLGGFLFGFWFGAFLNIFSTFLGAALGFYVSRYLFKGYFQRKFGSHLKKINKEVEKFGFNYFLSLRLILAFPYFLINILGGISKLSKRKYLLSSFLGVLPASFVYAYAGQKLEDLKSLSDVVSFEIFLAFILIAFLSLVPAIIKHRFFKNFVKKLKNFKTKK